MFLLWLWAVLMNESSLQMSIDRGLLDLIKNVNQAKLVWPM